MKIVDAKINYSAASNQFVTVNGKVSVPSGYKAVGVVGFNTADPRVFVATISVDDGGTASLGIAVEHAQAV